jgi:Asp-tRNA(Asn)/Glu-tRNA(Gln) amidotransferase A subunit family amidase
VPTAPADADAANMRFVRDCVAALRADPVRWSFLGPLAQGLPMGLQLIGRRADESTVLRIFQGT